MTEWSEIARDTIDAVHATLPKDATLEERKAALKAAYPFDGREHWPYKAWLKAQAAYLDRYRPPKPIPEHLLGLYR